MFAHIQMTPERNRQIMANEAEKRRADGRALVYVDPGSVRHLEFKDGRQYSGDLYNYEKGRYYEFTVEPDGTIDLKLHVFVPTLDRSYRLRPAKLTAEYEKLIREAIPVYEASDKTIYVKF